MSRLLVGRSLRNVYVLIIALGPGCSIQREGEGSDLRDLPEAAATGSGGHGTAGTVTSGASGAFGLGGANGGRGGSMGEGGTAGSTASGGHGGSAGDGGSDIDAGKPIDAGSVDAAHDVSMTDVIGDVTIDVARDAGPDTALTDAGARDAEASVDAGAKPDGCISTGTEVCDGLDNNCNGSVDEQNACPDGCTGIAHLGKGYMFCFAQTRQATWPDAQAACVSRGMHLVRIDDATENQWIVDTTLALGDNGGIWIGANDRQTDGVWVWTDGVQFWQGAGTGAPVGGRYNDWSAGQPNNNADGGEACAELEPGGTPGWNDLGCDDFTRDYVCER